MRLKAGDKVDRFIVEGNIGAGGTATVYRVRHERLGTFHALKLLSLASQTIRERLLVEGQAQATMNHPNIVSVTDILDIEGQPGLLMEYIDGPSLEDALAKFPFTLTDLEHLFLGVLDGVEAAHAQGLVHRDLKLANVLLAPTERGFQPKVTDFGLAKVLYNQPGVAATQSGVAMGTPGFMAPEQVRDAGSVDQRADMFSLGCILYEMVSGERTFPGDEILQIYIKVTKVDYTPIREHVPDLPDRFEAAIRGCLQLDPEERIPDVATLRSVLRGDIGWNKGAVPISTPSIGDPDTTVETTPSDRVVPVLLVGGSVALLGFVLLFAALGIGVPLLLRPSSTPAVPVEPTPDPVEQPAPEPAAAPDDEPDEEEPTDEDPEDEQEAVQPPEPEAAPEPVVPRPRPREPLVPRPEFETPTRHPIPRPVPQPTAPAPVAPRMPTSIAMKVRSKPHSALIVIDGQSTNLRTPQKLNIVPGTHRIDLQLRDHPLVGFNVVVGPASPTSWCYDFATGVPNPGSCPR